LSIAALAGCMRMLGEDRRKVFLLAGFPAVFYLLIGTSYLQIDRYILPMVPFLCLFASLFVDVLQERVFSPINAGRGWVLVTLLLLVQPVYNCCLAGHLAIVQTDTCGAVEQWISHNIPEGDTIMVPIHSRVSLPAERLCPMPETYTDVTPRTWRALAGIVDALAALPLLPLPYQEMLSLKTQQFVDLADESPTVADSRALHLSHYRQDGCKWAIMSREWKDKFYCPWTMECYPQMAESWHRFFSEVDSNSELVFRISPGIPQHPWGLGFMGNPTISVYRLCGDIEMIEGGN